MLLAALHTWGADLLAAISRHLPPAPAISHLADRAARTRVGRCRARDPRRSAAAAWLARAATCLDGGVRRGGGRGANAEPQPRVQNPSALPDARGGWRWGADGLLWMLETSRCVWGGGRCGGRLAGGRCEGRLAGGRCGGRLAGGPPNTPYSAASASQPLDRSLRTRLRCTRPTPSCRRSTASSCCPARSTARPGGVSPPNEWRRRLTAVTSPPFLTKCPRRR